MANRLIQEQSPYLLQHAHNPVDWYPWGDQPFERAQKENKPVIVSIGYSACHWCHVMERESFEDNDIAAFMNQHFINIKVDREEHPEVDHLYMDAVQAISGSGGWPLNVFVTAERLPFYGGTYFPPRPAFNRPSWMQLLQRMHEVWTLQHEEVKNQTEQMLNFLRQSAQVSLTNSGAFSKDGCRLLAENLLKQVDRQYGGFGTAPKFPGSMSINFLLEHYHFFKNEEALKGALLSLDGMMNGGIYDQLGGGFARYSTDAKWLAPHFEKMLYDNALLILSFCDAYQIAGNQRYREIVEETIAFVERELRDETGIYYSALDADSEGVEGKFYTWTWDEWNECVNDEVVTTYFGVNAEGNWEGTNILHVTTTVAELSERFDVSIEEARRRIAVAKERLFDSRAVRIRPLTDDKSLLSWNALMNLALTKAGVVLQNNNYLKRAKEHAIFLLEAFKKEDGLKHVWKGGQARIEANLDDYTYFIQALLQLASATSDETLLFEAEKLCQTVIGEFADEEGKLFYYTSSMQRDIPVRKVDIYDGAMPSANAVMAHNLLLLGLCLERTDWMEQADHMLQSLCEASTRSPSSFAYWGTLLQRTLFESKTVIAVGGDAKKNVAELRKYFLPDCFLLAFEKEISELTILKDKFFSDESLIFVCTQQACLAPVRNVEGSLRLISAN
ncbi:MAG TPA: thioredoxin domain-containing protein [Flavipsychrobacter sp.]|nr:thioredoxin domain-containing protein [Flavipsychrobacter sp.]